MAGGGESQSLGNVKSDAELCAVFESFAQARRIRLKRCFQTRTAIPFRFLHRTSAGHERQAVRHRQRQARAVYRRRRFRRFSNQYNNTHCENHKMTVRIYTPYHLLLLREKKLNRYLFRFRFRFLIN